MADYSTIDAWLQRDDDELFYAPTDFTHDPSCPALVTDHPCTCRVGTLDASED